MERLDVTLVAIGDHFQFDGCPALVVCLILTDRIDEIRIKKTADTRRWRSVDSSFAPFDTGYPIFEIDFVQSGRS